MFPISDKKGRSFTRPSFLKKNLGGFTLIEIMVVIVIIGILVGIVIVGAGLARNKAKDARVTSDMLQLQNLAERIYLDERNYDKVDPTQSPEIAALRDDISRQNSELFIRRSDSSAEKFCAYAKLNIIQFGYPVNFCVDYLGESRKVLTNGIGCHIDMVKPCYPCVDLTGDGVVTLSGYSRDSAYPTGPPDPPPYYCDCQPCVPLGSGCCTEKWDLCPFFDHIGAMPGDPNWDPRLDFDGSGDISASDDVFIYIGQDGTVCQ